MQNFYLPMKVVDGFNKFIWNGAVGEKKVKKVKKRKSADFDACERSTDLRERLLIEVSLYIFLQFNLIC